MADAKQNEQKDVVMRLLRSYVIELTTEQKHRHRMALQGLRKMLSNRENPPIQQVIDLGIVPRILAFLPFDEDADIQVCSAHITYLSDPSRVPSWIPSTMQFGS